MNQPITIITGAGSGVGRSLAIALAAQGHHIALAGRTRSKLEETASQCSASPGLMIHTTDLRDEPSAATLVDDVIARWGRIDNLVNCAGVAPLSPIDRTTDDILRDTFSVNAIGPAHLIIRCWPHFKTQKSGRIVNVSTMGTTDPFAGFFAYAASKSALDSMTRSAAKEGLGIGVKVFGVNLGAVETPMLRSNFSEKVLPHHRTLSPEFVANVISDCLNGTRDADNGRCIPVPSP